MKAKILFINAVALIIGLSSCKKEAGPTGATGSQGPSGPVLTGNLKGYINHYDLSGAKIATGLLGDSVSIDGTTTVSVTDATGMFTFNGLTTGVYNLTVKRAGYGINKIQSVQFTGGGDTYRNANISKMPTTNVSTFMAYDTTITVSSIPINYVRVRGTIPAVPYVQSIIVFVGNPGSTTCNSSSAYQSSFYVINIGANATTYSRNIPTSDLYDLGYVSGNTVYGAAYTIGGNTNASSYSDLTNNRTIFTALGTSPSFANALVQ